MGSMRSLLLLSTLLTSRAFMSPRQATTSSRLSQTINDFTSTAKQSPELPTMIVFDLDDCLWSPEMYTLSAKPSIPVEGDLGDGTQGVVGLKVPPAGPTVRLFSGARQVLRELATDPQYQGVILAAASSSEEPSFSYACLEGIEVVKGVTLRDMLQYDQIGRTGRLTSDKKTHFKLLHQESGVAYEEMLFFDDCNWGDHCGRVSREFGVVSQRTPAGMQYSEFVQGMEQYAKMAQRKMAGY